MKNLKKLHFVGLIMILAFVFSVSALAEQDAKVAKQDVKVNINTATVEQLATLKYIGEKNAQKIIDYRVKNGPFEKVEDILNVSGIGPKTVEVNKDKIVIN